MSSTNTMKYVRLGNSGLKVSRIILGCMSYGKKGWGGWVLPEDEGIEHIKAAYDMGINTFDTSPNYSNGESERILGKAIKVHGLPRDEIVVMTKVYFVMGREDKNIFHLGQEELDRQRYTNQYGLTRKNILQSVKHSLERLQLDYIDVLQCHRFDEFTPVEETMQALHDVVKAGYVRYIGMSSCWAWQFQKLQNYAKEHGLTQFISMQNHYNAVYREEEREMVPLLQDLGVGMIPWASLAFGYLTRPAEAQQSTKRKDEDPWATMTAHTETEPWPKDINRRIEEVAQKRNFSMAQVTLAWTLSKPFMTAPIVGSTSIDKLKQLADAIHITLPDEDVKYIDELYKPRAVFGHA